MDAKFPTSTTSRQRASPGAVAWGIGWLLAWFLGLGRALGEPDEGRYAEVAREMLVGRDWVTPHLDGFRFFDKPPLHYWASAAAYAVFGIHPWSARLWCALTGLLAIFATGWAGRRLFGREVGGYAMVILGSSLVFFMAAHIDTLDVGVSAFLAIGLAFFLVDQFDPVASDRRVWMNLAMWASLALAILSKGLIGVVVPGMALAVFMLWQRDFRLLRRTSPWIGMIVIAVIAAPWFVMICRRHPGFFDYFFIREHFTRFLTADDGRSKPLGFFIPVVVLGLLPWTPMLPWLPSEWKLPARSEPARRFLLVWVGVIFLFFSASHSKLTFYVLPLFPAAALLLAWSVARRSPGSLQRRLRWVTGLAVCAAGAAVIAVFIVRGASHGPLQIALEGGAAAMALIALAAWAGAHAVQLGRRSLAIHLLASGALLAWQGVLFASQPYVMTKSAAPIAKIINAAMDAHTELFVVQTYQGGLPFYTGKLVTVVAEHRDDLAPGLASRPRGYIAHLAAFEQRWRASQDALAVVRTSMIDRLRRDGVPFDPLAPAVNGRVVIRRTENEPASSVRSMP